ncbi:hypothetical protein EX30DRAFT_351795 [Ascodesmis nigricans]|uniref:Uncharacterized protein n=1 Tax=Ascodesmis nigricans TaxID=341454 RepID=A0A4V3SHU8_9PEZI|nr:hypothetical protein EX30DRAFT_351795 [Ascodesmis nigricans]
MIARATAGLGGGHGGMNCQADQSVTGELNEDHQLSLAMPIHRERKFIDLHGHPVLRVLFGARVDEGSEWLSANQNFRTPASVSLCTTTNFLPRPQRLFPTIPLLHLTPPALFRRPSNLQPPPSPPSSPPDNPPTQAARSRTTARSSTYPRRSQHHHPSVVSLLDHSPPLPHSRSSEAPSDFVCPPATARTAPPTKPYRLRHCRHPRPLFVRVRRR